MSRILPDSLVVRVESHGIPMADVWVEWTLIGDGWKGDLSSFGTPTDDAGEASVRWRLGPVSRVQEVHAQVDGLPSAAFLAFAEPGPVDSLIVEPDTLLFYTIGVTSRFHVTAVDRFGNTVADSVRAAWFPVVPGVVSVDITGMATSLADGETAVEARLADASGGGFVRVRLPVATLELFPETALGLTGDTIRVIPVPRSADGTLLRRDGHIDWRSSDSTVATVDSTGLVLLTGSGGSTISATVDGVRAECTVEVNLGSGIRVPELVHFDSIVPRLLVEHDLPGAAVAVVRDGRLVLARGYGVEDRASGSPVQPDALFRIASVSKPITATAVLRLVEEGRLGLETPVFPLLHWLPPATDTDPRLDDITVRHLLTHAGGWDQREAGFDPMFGAREIADRLGIPPPAGSRDIIRYMRGHPLQFTPGTRFAYSNLGYAILGRVVETVTGMPYAEHVRETLLQPLGIHQVRTGHSLAHDRLDDEVHYHFPGLAPSVFPPHDPVPIPYGSFYLEAMDAHGGWAASAVDLVRFGRAVDGNGASYDVLSPETWMTALRRPDLPEWRFTDRYYGMGWWVEQTGHGRRYWHDGSLAGSTAILARHESGRVVWALVSNGSADPASLIRAVRAAVDATERWPLHDLFPDFP